MTGYTFVNDCVDAMLNNPEALKEFNNSFLFGCAHISEDYDAKSYNETVKFELYPSNIFSSLYTFYDLPYFAQFLIMFIFLSEEFSYYVTELRRETRIYKANKRTTSLASSIIENVKNKTLAENIIREIDFYRVNFHLQYKFECLFDTLKESTNRFMYEDFYSLMEALDVMYGDEDY